MTADKKHINWNIILTISVTFAVLSVVALFSCILFRKIAPVETPAPTEQPCYTIIDSFEQAIRDDLTVARDAVKNATRVFWISENVELAPTP